MLADKKKLMIVAVLAVVVIGVGAFELTGHSSEPQAPPVGHSHTRARHKGAAGDTAATPASNEAAGTTNPTPDGTAPGTAPGAAPGSTPGQPNGTGAPTATAVPAQLSLPTRDPFDGSKYMPSDKKQGPQAPATPNKAPSKAATSPRVPIAEKIPPVIPGGPDLGGGVTGVPSKVNVPQAVFEYSLTGVITGDVPLAVFTDSKGDQRLVKEGASLDGDTKVVSIGHSTVTVSFHGKTKTLTVGADNPTEKRSDEK